MGACAALVAAAPGAARAQQPAAARGWNDSTTQALVRLATERRARQLADTGLVDYRATARGYLTFLAQLGTGELGEQQFPEPPRIVKSDELALEVFWKAPGLSKQRIVGRRDTLLLPTDISYHRDHLGIVQNNFPSVIRLGDGDEVLDVPHPLSAVGGAAYDFVIRDSLRIRLSRDRSIEVYEVRVRPRVETLPRAVGAVYIDRAEGQVVRMAFSFTRAALRDKQLEDVSVVLENSLINGRFWLPRRQEIEIRRTGAFMKFPARGIIRGRWEISDYAVNGGLSTALFAGPEIVQAPPSEMAAYAWRGRLLDSLPPDVRVTTDADVARVQAEARALVRSEALARAERLTLSGGRASDFVRANRVEGLALGGALSRRLGAGLEATVGGRWGVEDAAAKGHATLAWQRASGRGLRVSLYRAYREAGDEPEVSLVRNSFAAQEFGSDYTQPFDARGVRATAHLGTRFGARWQAEGSYEAQAPLGVNAAPAFGAFEPTIAAARATAARVLLGADRARDAGPLGTTVGGRVELRATRLEPRGDGAGALAAPTTVSRVFAAADAERDVGRRRLLLRLTGAYADGTAGVPAQELVYLGGPTSGPGYRFHEFVGELGGTVRAEWQTPVPFPSLPLGRFGRTAGQATLAPFAHAVYLARPVAGPLGGRDRGGWYPAVGVGAITLFDVLRFDAARGLRDGRWTFSVDASRAFWGVL